MGGHVHRFAVGQRPDLSATASRLRKIDDTGAQTFLTSCSDCRRTFDDALTHFKSDKTPHSLLELVADNLIGAARST